MSGQQEEDIPSVVHVTSYPKIIFLWPTWILSFILWLIGVTGLVDVGGGTSTAITLDWIWIGFFTFNIFVIAFEFAAGKFLAIIMIIFGVLIALFLLPPGTLGFNFPQLGISTEFYLVFLIIFSVIFLMLWVSRKFNYLEITHQQISYHVGILADERRYPVPGIHFEKHTDDVFERIMPPFCAKLVMKTEKGDIAEILDCVPRINKKLSDIKKILDYLQIKPGTFQQS